MNQVDFIGNVLSLSCGEALGTFQGEVSAVSKDAQTISLKNAYRNGVKYEVPEVTIRAIDIKDLQILKTFEQVLQEKVQNIAARKPPKVIIGPNGKIVEKNGIKKAKPPTQKGGKSPPKSDSTRNGTPKKNGELNGAPNRTPKSKTIDSGDVTKKGGSCKRLSYHQDQENNGYPMVGNKGESSKEDGGRGGGGMGDSNRRRHPSAGKNKDLARNSNPPVQGSALLQDEHSTNNNKPQKSQPIKIETGGKGRGGRGGINSRNKECFSAPTDNTLEDFDFEMNLKLFDKAAVFEEIHALSGDEAPVKRNYRHDENILTDADISNGHCNMMEGAPMLYKTVSGVSVPSVSTIEQHKLFMSAEKAGLSSDRRVEATGINAAHMAMQLLGGAKRFSGDSDHQTPSVVVLAGPHIQGAQGVCCARHLANHDINVTLYSPSYIKMVDSITTELTLFQETDGTHITNVQDLPATPVDLIILAFDCPNDVIIRDRPWYSSAIRWTTKHKQATTFAIDPPADSTLKAQYTMALALPLSYMHDVGGLYLCDVGIPKKVFVSLGIEYVAPFGHRHVIPLRNS